MMLNENNPKYDSISLLCRADVIGHRLSNSRITFYHRWLGYICAQYDLECL